MLELQRTLGNRTVQRLTQPASAQGPGVDTDGALLVEPPGLDAPGRPLPAPVRAKMEGFFQADFSDVRVHVGPQAQAIGADALALGPRLYFAPGRYEPHTSHGQQVLGHELTHVLQQEAGQVRSPFATGTAVVEDAALEAEADRMGERAAAPTTPWSGGPVPAATAGRSSGRTAAASGGVAQAKGLGWLFRKIFGRRRTNNNQATAPHAPPMQQATTTQVPEEIHRQAYNNARFYHNVRDASNIPSILQHGLLNYNDRINALGGDVGGHSMISREFQGDEQKGVFMGKKGLSETNPSFTPNIRATLDPQRSKIYPQFTPNPNAPDAFFWDEKFRGGSERGGLINPTSIPPDTVWSGKFTDQPEQKQRAIVRAIAQHYPDPKPSEDEVLAAHLQGIDEGYISDDALDDA